MLLIPTVALGVMFVKLPRPLQVPTSVVPVMMGSAGLILPILVLTRAFRVRVVLGWMRSDFRSEILSLEERCLAMFRQQVALQRTMPMLLVITCGPIGSSGMAEVATAVSLIWQLSFFLVRDSSIQQDMDEVLGAFRQ